MEMDMSENQMPLVDGLYAGAHCDKDGSPLFCIKVGGAIFNVGRIDAVEDFLKSYRRENSASA